MAHLDIRVPVRWDDLDAYGHVNNAAVLTLLEEARIAAFWEAPADQRALGAPEVALPLGAMGAGAEVSTFIASCRVEYKRPIGHRRDGVVVRLWISRVGGASLDVDYQILAADDPSAAAPLVLARTTVVLVEAATGTPTRIPAEVRAELEGAAGEPLAFRG